MKKIKWSGDKLLGISALIISFATLISLIYQSRISREHEMKSAFPKLELWHNNSAEKFEWVLLNTGLGPGIIEDYYVVYEDSILQMDLQGFAHGYSDSLTNAIKIGTTSLTKGRIIQPGQELSLIRLGLDSVRNHPLLDALKYKASLTIKYSSVYDQMWLIEGVADIPKLIGEDAKVYQQMLED